MNPNVSSEEQADLLTQVTKHSTDVTLQRECNNKSKNNSKSRINFNTQASTCARLLSLAVPSNNQCLLHLTRCGHLILSTALFICTAQYGQLTSHWESSGFSLLCFVMTISTTALMLLMGLRRFWNPSFALHSNLPIRDIVRDACLFSASLIGMSFCRERNYVPCHLQDGLFFSAIPVCIIYLTSVKGREAVDNKYVKPIFLMTSFMCLIFLSSVPQFAHTHKCRGVSIPNDDGISDRDTSSEVLWIIVYVIFIGLLSASLCGFWCNIQDHENSGRLSMQWTAWFHVASLSFFTFLFWINLFPSIGGSSSLEDFAHKLRNTWVCHFTNNCAITANLGFYNALFWLLFIFLSNLLVYRFQGNPAVVVANASLAIPLLNVFYATFTVDYSVIEFKGDITIGSLVCIVTCPIAYIILSYYHSASIYLGQTDKFDVF